MIGIGNMISNAIGTEKFKNGLPKLTYSGEAPDSFHDALELKNNVDQAMIDFRKADNTKNDYNPEKGKISAFYLEGKSTNGNSASRTGTLQYNPKTEKPEKFESKVHFSYSEKLEYQDKGETAEYSKHWASGPVTKLVVNKETGAIAQFNISTDTYKYNL